MSIDDAIGHPSSGHLSSHRSLHRTFLPVFLVLYFVVGMARIGGKEIYPFASWAMFSTVPNEVVKYRLRILRIADKPFEPPLDYVDAEAVLSKPIKISTITTVNSFGTALRGGDTPKAEGLRAIIDQSLPGKTDYEIIEQRYWPLEKWRHEVFDETRVAVLRTDDAAR